MTELAVFLVSALAGFLTGAFLAFLIGKRFLKVESRRLYERWLRQEHFKRRDFTARLLHDLKNPLFLIQAFTWTYLERLKRSEEVSGEWKTSSEQLRQCLDRQTNKALGILKEIYEIEPELPAPAEALWCRLASRRSIRDKINHSRWEVSIPKGLMIRGDWLILEEGLEELLLIFLEKSGIPIEAKVSFAPLPHGILIEIVFKGEAPDLQVFQEAQSDANIWANSTALITEKNRTCGLRLEFKWKTRPE